MKLLMENWRTYLGEQKSQKYYYGSRTELKPGMEIRKWTSKVEKVESVFEKVRQEEFPDRPSRIGAVFVCDSMEGFCESDWYRRYVYEVQISPNANLFKTDAKIISEAVSVLNEIGGFGKKAKAHFEKMKRNSMIKRARAYWEGNPPFRMPEIIVQGKVIIRKEVGRYDEKEDRSFR